MARTNAVWGIDVGNGSLKALRCRLDNPPTRLVAEAFDYVEYPKNLTQRDAERGELICDALRQFLSRNSVRRDRVAMSVPSQNSLVRFFQPPPVDARKVPDIVRFEPMQAIPFPLDELIWDHQQMPSGLDLHGFIMETEIVVVAMKRYEVLEALEPFRKVGIKVDFVQMTQMALFNYLLFDQLLHLPLADAYNPENRPPWTVSLSLGTDTTDMMITNGCQLWQRNIPLGGNHFTKQLTKEMKLTFAEAEHLKRNVREAENAKAVIQAMRPVFNDLLLEVQRSIGFFQNINRNAEISGMVMLGNAVKLPGLQQYLSKNLGYATVRLESFNNLVGTAVLDAPVFKENLLSFGVCYGLAVQAAGRGDLKTNLLPSKRAKLWRKLFNVVFGRLMSGP
jgi:type IV pilus assembly protein PilM